MVDENVKSMELYGVFPSTDFDENCTIHDGDCNGENYSVMCFMIDIFSATIVIINLIIFLIGIVVIRRKIVQGIRVCEFYLILNLAFSDMVTGILSLTIDAWDYIAEVS